jgi:hypothetical protein
MITVGSPETSFTRHTRTVPRSENSLGSVEKYRRVVHLTEEGAVDDMVPICCFCSKVRDDRNTAAGKGPWMHLSTYARSRQLPLSHSFVYSHGYCPDCVAHFDERMADYRSTTAWESLREAARRLIGGTHRDQRVGPKTRSNTVSAVEDVLSDGKEANGAVY